MSTNSKFRWARVADKPQTGRDFFVSFLYFVLANSEAACSRALLYDAAGLPSRGIFHNSRDFFISENK